MGVATRMRLAVQTGRHTLHDAGPRRMDQPIRVVHGNPDGAAAHRWAGGETDDD